MTGRDTKQVQSIDQQLKNMISNAAAFKGFNTHIGVETEPVEAFGKEHSMLSGLYDGHNPFTPSKGKAWNCLVSLRCENANFNLQDRLQEALPEIFPLSIIGSCYVKVAALSLKSKNTDVDNYLQSYTWEINYTDYGKPKTGAIKEEYSSKDKS